MYIAGALRDQQHAHRRQSQYRVSKLWGDGEEWACNDYDEAARILGYPALRLASHDAPQRTVLAPPPEFGVDWRRVGTMLRRRPERRRHLGHAERGRSACPVDRRGAHGFARSRASRRALR